MSLEWVSILAKLDCNTMWEKGVRHPRLKFYSNRLLFYQSRRLILWFQRWCQKKSTFTAGIKLKFLYHHFQHPWLALRRSYSPYKPIQNSWRRILSDHPWKSQPIWFLGNQSLIYDDLKHLKVTWNRPQIDA